MSKPVPSKTENRPGFTHEIPEFILNRISFLLNRTGQWIREATEANLKSHQMTGKHIGILATIADHGSVAQNEIGLCMSIDRTTIVNMLDELEKMGLVERKENPADRRAHALVLTAKGKEVLPQVQKLAMDAEKKFLSGLSGKDQKELVRLLKQLLASHYPQTHELRG